MTQTTPRDKLAAQIHYPECWDTAAYPSLEDALWEVMGDQECSECKRIEEALNGQITTYSSV